MANQFFLMAVVNGFLVVAIGAFGAHGLEGILTPARLATFQTGVNYHMFHVVGLLAAALLWAQFPDAGQFAWSGYSFLVGIILFSGSLYLLAITGVRPLGIITPFGGVAFLAGWALLAYGLLKVR